MRRVWVAIGAVGMLAIVAIALVGWDLTRGRGGTAPTPSPAIAPTVVVATASPAATVTVRVVSSPVPTAPAPPPPVATASPDPGPATLASGAEVQQGRHGYTFWCASDAAGTCVMTERYGGPVPRDALRVPPGGPLTFVYGGPEPLAAISSLVYPLGAGDTGDYPTLRGGTPAPTAQADRRATITGPATPGQYVLIVRITGSGNTTADLQFRLLVG